VTSGIIINLINNKSDTLYKDHNLNEIVNLSKTLNIKCVVKENIKINNFSPSTLLSSGKLLDLKIQIDTNKIDLLVLNYPLTPSQQKNLEKYLNIKVIDRTGLIIEIFADRALTSEGKLQVELANLSYRKSRLVRAWTHLERQRGGHSFIGGPGELQIELDRRLIQERINSVKKDLKKIIKRRANQRNNRKKNVNKSFALVGYTNSGKSTLFNKLTKKNEYAKDELFATLDTKISKIFLNSKKATIIDTVGFISKIPTQLIDAFKATLEEVNESDVLINVVDINDINFRDKIKTTKKVLLSTGVSDEKIKNMITVYNKIDTFRDREFRNTKNRIYLSALNGKGVEEFRSILSENY
jgi:GTP-binding protein HflX|tara:strand:- start:2279 stop:3343 length:1065 start_codon:yes stop_codon:yes gene_type:complete